MWPFSSFPTVPTDCLRNRYDYIVVGGAHLAMVRREIEPGASITAKWDDTEVAATVTALPFADPS